MLKMLYGAKKKVTFPSRGTYRRCTRYDTFDGEDPCLVMSSHCAQATSQDNDLYAKMQEHLKRLSDILQAAAAWNPSDCANEKGCLAEFQEVDVSAVVQEQSKIMSSLLVGERFNTLFLTLLNILFHLFTAHPLRSHGQRVSTSPFRYDAADRSVFGQQLGVSFAPATSTLWS